jgi:predicted DNA binding CopG/RHH family protein
MKTKKKIDYSDIPPSTDEELANAKRVGRPKSGTTKQLIAIRLDPKLIFQLKKLAKKQDIPYQSLVHQLLEDAVKKAA